MGGFISIFIVLAALVTMVGMMYLVLNEKHVDESKVNYVRSPYAGKPEAPKPAEDHKPIETGFTPKESTAAPAVDVGAAVAEAVEAVDASAGHATPEAPASEASPVEKADSGAADQPEA